MAHSDEQHHQHIHLEDGDASVSAELITTAEGNGTARASIPLGDTESLLELTRRCQDVVVRAAGTTALVDARLGNETSR